jgi:hypothetical protein
MDLKRINGNDLSWGSGIIKIAGARLHGIQEIDFGDKRVRELVWGMSKSGAPRARTTGEYQPDEGRLLVPESSAVRIRRGLANAIGSTSYGDAEFLLDITWREAGSDAEMSTVQLVSTVITGDKAAPKRGPGPVLAELAIQYKRIVRNGLTLYSVDDN